MHGGQGGSPCIHQETGGRGPWETEASCMWGRTDEWALPLFFMDALDPLSPLLKDSGFPASGPCAFSSFTSFLFPFISCSVSYVSQRCTILMQFYSGRQSSIQFVEFQTRIYLRYLPATFARKLLCLCRDTCWGKADLGAGAQPERHNPPPHPLPFPGFVCGSHSLTRSPQRPSERAAGGRTG